MGINSTNAVKWRDDILPKETKRALELFAGESWLKRSSWYLAGGTALALCVGHRQSHDLDFFIHRSSFSSARLVEHLKEIGGEIDMLDEGTLYGRLSGAKISFIAYPFFIHKEKPVWYGAVRVLTPRDIAVMKIVAISQRGTKRDFVDLYWYVMHAEPLIDVIKRLPKQYPTVAHDYHHILKSMNYFGDADSNPMPTLFFDASWDDIKNYFKKEVPRVAKKLLKLK